MKNLSKTAKIIIAVVAVVVAIAIIITGSIIGTKNKLAVMQENVNSASANVDTYLQRRADLIPNVVATVKSYAAHETEVYDKVLEARQNLMNANTIEEKANANSELSTALQGINVIVEAYPELKSDSTYIGLMDELEGSENRIATARKDYNDAVKAYNSALVKFPTSLVAGMFGYEKAAYFEADAGAEKAPDVGGMLGD
jgi:LemA protein